MTTNRNRLKSRAIWFSLTVLCGLQCAVASANEVLHDPTRPPTFVFTPQEREIVNVGPVLQSIAFASGRRTAVISGQTVKTGSKIGEAKVVRINETEVVLKTGNSLQTLKLFPDVEKHSVTNIRRHKP